MARAFTQCFTNRMRISLHSICAMLGTLNYFREIIAYKTQLTLYWGRRVVRIGEWKIKSAHLRDWNAIEAYEDNNMYCIVLSVNAIFIQSDTDDKILKCIVDLIGYCSLLRGRCSEYTYI